MTVKSLLLVCIAVILLLVITGCARKEQPETEGKIIKTEGIAMKATDPVCGMETDTKSTEKTEYEGKTYYFCSEECKEQFLKEPGKYGKTGEVNDPVCGMNVSESTLLMVEHGGETYHFCSEGCQEKFKKEPEKFLNK